LAWLSAKLKEQRFLTPLRFLAGSIKSYSQIFIFSLDKEIILVAGVYNQKIKDG
jgi:hypothetical protein